MKNRFSKAEYHNIDYEMVRMFELIQKNQFIFVVRTLSCHPAFCRSLICVPSV